jgi:hypothetical protein
MRFLGIILEVLRLEFSYKLFSLQTSFKPLLLKGGGGVGVKFVIEVIVNSKEENS